MKRIDPWILGAIAVALAVRLARLDTADLWLDEALTLQRIQLPWARSVLYELFSGGDANQLPGYFILLKAWASLAGTSTLALRIPSVVFSLVTVVLTTALAGTLAGNRAARWTAWLAAISPYLLHHAQEARMYPLLSALAAASLLLLARYLRGRVSGLGATFIIVNLLLLATHYYSMFFVGAVLLVLLLRHRRPWSSWLPAGAISALFVLGLMLLAVLVAGHTSGAVYKTGFLAFPGVIWSMLSGYTLMPSPAELHVEGVRAVLPFLPVALLCAVPACLLAVSGVRALDSDARLVLLTTFLIPVLAPFMVSLVFPGVSINPRYAMPAAPAMLALFGIAIARGYQAHFTIRLSSLILIAVMATGTVRHLITPGHGREDIRAAGKWLDAHVPTDEPVVVTSFEMQLLAAIRWPDRKFVLYPDRNTIATRKNAAALASALPRTAPGRTVYLFGRSWLSDPGNALRDDLVKDYKQCPGLEARGIRILCLLR